MDHQALAIAVEEFVGGRPAQAFTHRPDVGLDDAPAERVVECLDIEFGEDVGGVGGLHGATFAPGEPRGKRSRRDAGLSRFTDRARRARLQVALDFSIYRPVVSKAPPFARDASAAFRRV